MEHALAQLPPDPSGEVAQMGFADLVHVYAIWRDRLIPQRRRRVHLSKEQLSHEKATEHEQALDALISKIKTGGDLAPHLSKRVRTAHVPSKEIKEGKEHLRKDRDRLLADWGIHHLHLSVDHGPDLLFAIFRPDDAYLIKIYQHEWTPLEALEIVVRSWPDADLMMHSFSGWRLTREITERERSEMRKAAVTGMVEIDNAVYMPRGQTGDGSPINVVRREHRLAWALTDLREGRVTRQLREAEAAHDVTCGPPALRQWRPAVVGEHVGLMREGQFLPVSLLP